MYSIDPTKIKHDMIIHTPTLEQAQAVCDCINNKTKFNYFSWYKEGTCINTNDGKYWSYGSESYFKGKKYTITPFEDILVQESVSNKQTPLYLDRLPQMNDYVHRKSEYITIPSEVKKFKPNGNLIPCKITKCTSDVYLDYIVGAWSIHYFNVINPNHPSHPEYNLQTTLSNGSQLDAPSANPIPTIKESEMNNTTLKLLLALMGVTTETIKDATNSNYIGIITDEDNSYVGYVYADSIKQLKEIIAKSENEGNTIHCFKFQDSFKQATRPVVKVTRTTSEVVEESNVPG